MNASSLRRFAVNKQTNRLFTKLLSLQTRTFVLFCSVRWRSSAVRKIRTEGEANQAASDRWMDEWGPYCHRRNLPCLRRLQWQYDHCLTGVCVRWQEETPWNIRRRNRFTNSLSCVQYSVNEMERLLSRKSNSEHLWPFNTMNSLLIVVYCVFFCLLVTLSTNQTSYIRQ